MKTEQHRLRLISFHTGSQNPRMHILFWVTGKTTICCQDGDGKSITIDIHALQIETTTSIKIIIINRNHPFPPPSISVQIKE